MSSIPLPRAASRAPLAALLLAAALPAVAAPPADNPAPPAGHRYYTHGVHNDVGCVPEEKCISPRRAGEPSDPQFPPYWSADWTMYRVFKGWRLNPPPYDSPPDRNPHNHLKPTDYETSRGHSLYDSEWTPPDRDGSGAMMEMYEKRCLPIFPMDNRYSCAFVSLGNKAYFLRWPGEDSSGEPSICSFSDANHPPRTDFVKHLPYSRQRSALLGNKVQAYALEVPAGPGVKILFGYSFDAEATPDSADPSAPPYRHPQSFYFSGQPTTPPDAPIVSQNYENFRMERPAASTWTRVLDRVGKQTPPLCCLFADDCPKPAGTVGATKAAPSWADLRP